MQNLDKFLWVAFIIGVLVYLMCAKRQQNYTKMAGGQLVEQAIVLPETVLLEDMTGPGSKPLGFKTNPPVIRDWSGANDNTHVKLITLETEDGAEYVQKVGKDKMITLFNHIFGQPFYVDKKEEEAHFFVKKLMRPEANAYRDNVVKYYKDITTVLSDGKIEPSGIENFEQWNPDFRKWFDIVLLLDMQLETFFWKDKQQSNNCTFINTKPPFTTKDALIGRNFDWMIKFYDGMPMHLFYFKNHGIMTMGFPGMVFCALTAINKNKVWGSFNNLAYSIGVSEEPQYPSITIDMFFNLKNTKSAHDYYNYLNKVNFDISVFYFVGDQTGAYCMAQKPRPLGEANFKVTEGDASLIAFARANKVLNPLWYVKKIADPNAWASDSLHRQVYAMKQLIDNKGKIDDKVLCHILQEPLYVGDLTPDDTNPELTYATGPTLYTARGKNLDHTIYQCVYNATTHMLYLRGNCVFKLDDPWYRVSMDIIFNT